MESISAGCPCLVRCAMIGAAMKIVLLTREYPPEVYGGAGVHVEYLSRELAKRATVEIRCFGAPRPSAGESLSVRAFQAWDRVEGVFGGAAGVISVNLAMLQDLDQATLVHSH